MDPVVNTKSGIVQGGIQKSCEGFDILSFKGIPYAEPPLGELRFKDPVPIKKWTGIKYAKKYCSLSMQFNPIEKHQCISEDCLYLNIFIKSKIESTARKAVMVWIHGGGFYSGTSDDTFCGPDYLLMHDVVLVTVNYRLGILGFLNLEDEVAPGNQGLKDQVLAIRWVHENIANFGGDPDNVTVFGESAGGASAHYLCLSPLSRDYVHKAISQSGVALNTWAAIANPKQHAYDVCKLLGKPLNKSKDIVEFLRTVDAKTLIKAQANLMTTANATIFGPSSDPKSMNPFMPIPIEEAAKVGVHKPYLIGFNSREGIFLTEDDYSNFLTSMKLEETLKLVDENFSMAFKYDTMKILDKYQLTPQQVRRLYFKSEHISIDQLDNFVDLLSDLVFTEGIHECLKIQVEHSSAPTYYYQLCYDKGPSVVKFGVMAEISGVSHFDDIQYLFHENIFDRLNIPHFKKGTKDYRVMEQMTTLWTNFAKYGKPTVATSQLIPVHWKPVNDTTVLRYLNIDEDLTMKSDLNISLKLSSAKSIII